MWATLSVGVLTVACAVCCHHDLRFQTIPNLLNAALLAVGIAVSAAGGAPGLLVSLWGVVIGLSAMWGMAAFFKLIRGGPGLGGGDLKFVAAAGAWVGPGGIAPLLLIASFTGIVALLIWTRLGRTPLASTRLPFGPFLSFATLVVWGCQATGNAPWSWGGEF